MPKKIKSLQKSIADSHLGWFAVTMEKIGINVAIKEL